MDAPLYIAERIPCKENGADQGAQPAQRAATATAPDAQLMRQAFWPCDLFQCPHSPQLVLPACAHLQFHSDTTTIDISAAAGFALQSATTSYVQICTCASGSGQSPPVCLLLKLQLRWKLNGVSSSKIRLAAKHQHIRLP
jgi:hypothetical protein